MRDFSNNLRKLLADGATLDTALSKLRADGASIVECIISVRGVFGYGLAEAKRVVHVSPAWADVRALNEQFHAELEAAASAFVLPTDILERVEAEFAGEDAIEVARLLATYTGPESERVQRCVLQLASGAVEKVSYFIEAARTDYRDVIYWAEYPQDP